MKFGGTSIKDVSCIRRVIDIIQSRLDHSPVLVFSAMGKTTRLLLEAARSRAAGNSESADFLKKDIEEYHRNIASELFGRKGTDCNLETLLEEFSCAFRSIPVHDRLSDQDHDRLISFGERFSTAIMVSALKKAGIGAIDLDARRIIRTDSRFTRAKPNMDSTRSAIREHLIPESSRRTVVTQGFIGSDEKGNTTTLGFEGSDFTAALLGWGTDAKEIQIWKDVPGVMTADPLIIEDVKTVPSLSYDEVEVLTRCGAKVLHPMTMAPARKKVIPVRILDSTNPNAPCTLISRSGGKGGPVRSITIRKDMVTVRIKVSRNDASRLFQKMQSENKDAGCPWICFSEKDGITIVTSADNWKTVASSSGLLNYSQNFSSSMALISLVGAALTGYRLRQQEVFEMMGNIPVQILSCTISPMARHLLVKETDSLSALRLLHENIFCLKHPSNFYFEVSHVKDSACWIRQNGTID